MPGRIGYVRLRRCALAGGLAGFLLAPLGGVSASCAAPYLQMHDGRERPTLNATDAVTVEGRAFVDGCSDGETQSVVWGCSVSSSEGGEEAPMSDIVLSIRQGARTFDVAVEDAGVAANNTLGQVTWTFTVPDEVKPGSAVLVADTARLQVVIQR